MIKKIDLLNRFKKIHRDKYNYNLVDYKGMLKPIKIYCPDHGIFEQLPNNHLSGSGCPFCNSVKVSKEEFIDRCKKKHNNFYDYSLTDFKGVAYKIKIICPDHGEFDQKASNHVAGQKCPYCSNKKHNNKMFIDKAIKIHDNKYDYSLVDYKNAHEKIKIICHDHGEFEQIPWNHISLKEGCPYCGKNKSNMELFLKKAKEVHKRRYDYSLFTEYTNVKEKIRIICPDHGEFIQQMNNHLNGQGCPVCLETKGERKIRNFLTDNNINFQQYKRFDKCRYKNPLPFDFYIPDKNICIEYDGPQHFEIITYFGGQKRLEYTILLDKIKDKFCEDNGINLFRIRYDDNLQLKLSELFDLTNDPKQI